MKVFVKLFQQLRHLSFDLGFKYQGIQVLRLIYEGDLETY